MWGIVIGAVVCLVAIPVYAALVLSSRISREEERGFQGTDEEK